MRRTLVSLMLAGVTMTATAAEEWDYATPSDAGLDPRSLEAMDAAVRKGDFKQKTAYEISLGLVGSEMCIRDRDGPLSPRCILILSGAADGSWPITLR